ncbi:MAG: septum formation initiator family protein [Syntrophobacteraceae bacterium]
MNRRVTRDENSRDKGGEGKLRIKGVYIVRLLVCCLLGLNALLLYAIFFSTNGLPGYSKQNDQVKELEERILKLKQENQKLFEKIEAFKKDPALQEKLVRQELGWVKENEIIIEFPENKRNPDDKQNPPGKQPVPAK